MCLQMGINIVNCAFLNDPVADDNIPCPVSAQWRAAAIMQETLRFIEAQAEDKRKTNQDIPLRMLCGTVQDFVQRSAVKRCQLSQRIC
jgi:hypothetical protein